MAKDFYGNEFQRDCDKETRETENLMMPGTYLPRKHRSRRMPKRKPRLNATESESGSKLVYTTETNRAGARAASPQQDE